MKRAYILIAIVVILVFSAFAISFGWYYYAGQSIKKFVGMEEKPLQKEVAAEQPAAEKEVVLRSARLKLGTRAAYRSPPNNARIFVSVKNIGGYIGSATIYAELSYKQNAVANGTFFIKSIPPGKEMNVTINIENYREWNAFDVRQI